jgi:P-type Cu+ transporter
MERSKKLNLTIGGMKCASCAAGIEKGLSALQGVKIAQVNYAMGTAAVNFEPDKVDERSILESITNLGYSPHIAKNNDDTFAGEMAAARRNFILALIFAFPVIILSMLTMFLRPHLITIGLKA